MFALLEHTTRAGVHWDLLIESAPDAPLVTWRLFDNPLLSPLPIAAERIADHRRIYLEYEGPISGDRGNVRRIDHGESTLIIDANAAHITLNGKHLRGQFIILTIQNRCVLEHAEADRTAPPSTPKSKIQNPKSA